MSRKCTYNDGIVRLTKTEREREQITKSNSATCPPSTKRKLHLLSTCHDWEFKTHPELQNFQNNEPKNSSLKVNPFLPSI